MYFGNFNIKRIGDFSMEDMGKITTFGTLTIGLLWATGYFIRSLKKVRI